MEKTILTKVQRKVLSLLARDSVVSKHFYLTGGTALAEYYLHHRLSEDLDFFSESEVDVQWLAIMAQKIKQGISAQSIDIQQSYNRNLVFLTIGKELLKTEFTYFPFSQIEKPKVIDGVYVDSLIDIAVNKFFTLYQKPASRHFIDLYMILQTASFRWDELAALARVKFDVVIDPLQLGSQLVTAQTIGQLPNIIVSLGEGKWRTFFIEKAKMLKKEVGS